MGDLFIGNGCSMGLWTRPVRLCLISFFIEETGSLAMDRRSLFLVCHAPIRLIYRCCHKSNSIIRSSGGRSVGRAVRSGQSDGQSVSRTVSRAVSRVGSRASSRSVSRTISRAGSQSVIRAVIRAVSRSGIVGRLVGRSVGRSVDRFSSSSQPEQHRNSVCSGRFRRKRTIKQSQPFSLYCRGILAETTCIQCMRVGRQL